MHVHKLCFKNIIAHCVDTDSLITVLCNIANIKRLVWMFVRYNNNKKKKKYKKNKTCTSGYVVPHKCVEMKICSTLPALHAITGWDYAGAFLRKGTI